MRKLFRESGKAWQTGRNYREGAAHIMFHRLASLRVRLVVAFLLVSVPPMLAATYVATRLIASAFEDNVQQWLEETSKFMLLQVRDSQLESGRLSQILARKMPEVHFADHPDAASMPEFEMVYATGYDMILVYDALGKVRFGSRPITEAVALPLKTQDVLLNFHQSDGRKILAGAVQEFTDNGQLYFVLVGSWVDDDSLGGIKIVSSLDLRLYTSVAGTLVPIFETLNNESSTIQLPDTILQQLKAKDEPVYDDNEDSATYRAVYAGLRDVDGTLVGVVFCGLARQESFLPRIGGWELFVGMFTLGSILSILAGLWMSGLLVRPLKALNRGVRLVTAGDYQQQVKVAGGKEVEELASSFNSMAAQLSTLKALEADLRRKDRLSALGQAAMVIAHEVRNPLGIIQTSAELVRSKARLPASEDRLLGYVVDEVRRIEGLIREFLDFAQPKAPLQERVAVRDVLERVADFTAHELENRKIRFVIEDEAPGVVVEGDADQLYQALLNLVLNAVDAMPRGGTLSGRIAREGATCSLTIADTGAGVPEEARARLFEPFFTTKARGSGLGLAKVRTVAEAHGGGAFYAAAPGGGAAFTITLAPIAGEAHA